MRRYLQNRAQPPLRRGRWKRGIFRLFLFGCDVRSAEIKAMEPLLAIKIESLHAILDEVTQSDARARKVKPQELVDSRYLDEMEKSGFMDRLWTKR
jgi:hypothetical protein